MKQTRFAAVLMLALVMVFAFSAMALADDSSITITGTTAGHTFEAYQIFTGTLSTNASGEKVLTNLAWGNGVNSTALLTALKADSAFGVGSANEFYRCATASDVAKVMDKVANDAAKAQAFAAVVGKNLTNLSSSATPSANATSCTIVVSSKGYYLVKEKDGSLAGQNAAYTRFILQVAGPTTAQPKTSIPTVEKKVQDINDSTDTAFGGLQDSADHDINDVIPYTLTGTLPSTLGDYTTYKYVFHDTLSAGLTYDNDAKVYLVTPAGEREITGNASINYTAPELTVSLANVKAVSGLTADSKIVVKYTATLNGNAVIGSAGNPNTVYLEYSNNPNATGSGVDETGKTPVDKVTVFTYQLVVNKVDENNRPLSGAEFALYKYDGTAYRLFGTPTVTGNVFNWKGLDDGKYMLEEVAAPTNYNKIEAPYYFTVTANHDALSADPQLTILNAQATSANGTALTSTDDGYIAFTATLSTGKLETTIINQPGVVLPATGGMGTTLFYVLGGLLLVGAAVVLITKRRVDSDAE